MCMKLKNKIENDLEKFKQTINSSNNYEDLCREYQVGSNGRHIRVFKELIESNKIDISFWIKNSKNIKYPKIEKICSICNKKFTTSSGHNKEKQTCSRQCANIRFAVPKTDEIKKKISESIKKFNISIGNVVKQNVLCKKCHKEFLPNNKYTKFCSKECASKSRIASQEQRDKLSAIMKNRVALGIHKGWQSRSIISYPEKFFMTVLKNNNIQYIHNKKEGKYFIDFALESKMIALEIDGKQHLRDDRKSNDLLKDEFLKNIGWLVYRIPWNSINTEDGKSTMKLKIDKFIEFYNLIGI